MMPPVPPVAVASVHAAAHRLRDLGLNPIRSDPILRHPPFAYADFRDHGVPRTDFDRWRFSSACFQTAMGSRWRVCAVDIDGEIAHEVWGAWTRFRPLPPTWQAATPSGGRHVWFAVPPAQPLRSRILAGLRSGSGWVKRSLVEFFGDRSLLMTAPSIRFLGAELAAYRWLPGQSPLDRPVPAPAPAWLLTLPDLTVNRAQPPTSLTVNRAQPPTRSRSSRHYDRNAVLAAIPDPVAVARDVLGVRVASATPNAAGWHRCHAVGREDRNPSASLSQRGSYWEPGYTQPVSLFTLGELTGRYATWLDCCHDLSSRYCTPGDLPHDHHPDRRRGREAD